MRTGLINIGVVAAICGGGRWATTARASDHDEAPLVKMDAAMDLTDVYVFASGPAKISIIVCWAGFNDSRAQPDEVPLFDRDALYTIFVDNDGDFAADHAIRWRYGMNAQGQWGVRWEGVPGTDGHVAGSVEAVFAVGSFARAWSGHADDPFFFDLQGYLETIEAGSFMFSSDRDFLAGFNVTAAAIEIDADVLSDGNDSIQVWATAARKL